MKIQGMSKKEILTRLFFMPVFWTVIIALNYLYKERTGVGDYLYNLRVWIMFMLFLQIVLTVLVLSGARDYILEPNGITCRPKLGRTKYYTWDTFAYVGPVIQNSSSRNRLILVCAPKEPIQHRKTDSGYTCKKGTLLIQFTPEARDALRYYCPFYSEQYERLPS